MLYNSYVFILAFLPITLVGFYFLSATGGQRPARLWLVVASLVYYGWWNPLYLLLIIGSMLFNYWLGSWLGNPTITAARRRIFLIAGLAANLVLLGYYKYAHFLVTNLNAVLGANWVFAQLILPLGISFFTFQQMAYLVDASRGEVCEYSLADYILFVTFFPQLIAGPIVHHAEMMPQFARPATYRFQWSNMAVGLTLFAIGLFKKVMVADALSGHVATVFKAAAAGQELYFSDAWAGALCYTFQIYFDFSGYSDMALGLGRMFGIILPLNFNSPLKATGIVDFWRRWHLTLSRCLRDYVYIPLGGNRKGEPRRYLHLVLTMFIGGIWHGAGWTFVLWGSLHGLCLAINHLWIAVRPSLYRHYAPPERMRIWSSRTLTFLVVVLTFVMFRANRLDDAGRIFSAMFDWAAPPQAGLPALLKPKLWFWLAALLVFVWQAPNAVELTRDYHPALETLKGSLAGINPRALCWRIQPLWAWLTAWLLAASILSLSQAGEFLYYNF